VILNLPASNTSNVNADTATLSETVSTDVLSYNYVQHALASFNSGSTQTTLDLNFGTLQQGALATTSRRRCSISAASASAASAPTALC
jgi:hypothetical protein